MKKEDEMADLYLFDHIYNTVIIFIPYIIICYD